MQAVPSPAVWSLAMYFITLISVRKEAIIRVRPMPIAFWGKAGGLAVLILDIAKGILGVWLGQQAGMLIAPDQIELCMIGGGLLAILAVLSASVFAMPPHKRRNKRAFAMVEGVGVNEGDENEVLRLG